MTSPTLVIADDDANMRALVRHTLSEELSERKAAARVRPLPSAFVTELAGSGLVGVVQ